jgi:hypothetical protein
LKFIYIKKDMSAEDDIFLAEASPIADRRKLPYHTILNKISITVCDVSKGVGGGGGSPEKRTYDVSHGQNRYARLP